MLAFSVVVLGGLGSIPGALIGGLVFGLVYEFGGTYCSSQRDVIIFAILILVLVVRPTGLLGREGLPLIGTWRSWSLGAALAILAAAPRPFRGSAPRRDDGAARAAAGGAVCLQHHRRSCSTR